MLKLINIVLLLNVLVPSHHSKLSADVEDRRNETKLHKTLTIQWDSAKYEWETYIVKDAK